MKKFFIATLTILTSITAKAQTDSIPPKMDTVVVVTTNEQKDSVRVGKLLIIIKSKKNKKGSTTEVTAEKMKRQKRKPSKSATNWFVVDLGFSNYIDKTDYSNTGSLLINQPGQADFSEGDFKLKTGKSVNVNIWFFMQRYSLYKNHLNLKYGLGLELNNYRYKSNISYKEGGVIPYSFPVQSTSSPFIFRDSISFAKNKLAADYITVPFMLNYTANPSDINKGISFSAGVSAGYLYSQRNKQKSIERGKQKNKGEYNLERFKLSYIAELGLGPVRLYGSYSPSSMYEKSLDMRPYTIGVRFSNW